MADILVTNGDVMWDGDDLVLIEGDEDIKQQAYLRSTADEGESVFYPTYGSKLFMYIGRGEGTPVKSYIESAARETLLKVKGVTEVLYVELLSIKDENEIINYYVFAKYKTLNGKTFSGEFTFSA